MPFYTIDIEDYSPFITYGPDWRPGTSANDNSTDQYSQSTFRCTNKGGASAKIAFNGTGITIYGAKRDNHGQYLVNVDGQDDILGSGFNSPNLFDQALFTKTDFDQGFHTVQITNQNDNLYLDIDYVKIQGNIGSNTTGHLYVINYQDSDDHFSYSPASQWSNPDNIGAFFGLSGHSTSSSQASFDFSFQGDGVSLYGPMSKNGAPYTVSLDGGQPITLQSSSDRYLPQSLLYHATNIGAGQHHLKVTCQPSANGQVFAVDYANVYTDDPTVVPGSTSSRPSSKDSGLSAGIAAGIAVAACVFVALLVLLPLLMFLLMKKRKQRQAEENMKNIQGQVNPYPSGNTGTRVTPSGHVSQFSTAPGFTVPVVSGSRSDYAPLPQDSGASSSNPNSLRHVAYRTNPSSEGVGNMYGDTPSPVPARKSRIDAGDTNRTTAIEHPPGYSM